MTGAGCTGVPPPLLPAPPKRAVTASYTVEDNSDVGPVEDCVNRQAVPGHSGRAYGELFPACIFNIIEHNSQPLTKLCLLLPQQAVISDRVDRGFGSGTDPAVRGFGGVFFFQRNWNGDLIRTTIGTRI